MTRLDTQTPQQLQQRRIPQQRGRHGVIVGMDGSVWGTAALEWATRYAWLRGTELTVYQAATDNPSHDTQEHLSAMQPLPVHVHAGSIDPLHTLVPVSGHSELAVVGCRGHQHGTIGLGRWVLPVVTAAQCDTVVVRGLPPAVHGRYRTITAAISSSGDQQILARAMAMATTYQARLEIVHACMDFTGRHEAVLEEAQDYVNLHAPQLATSVQLIRNRAPEMIATHTDTDLLVVGSGNSYRTGLGTVAKTALHHALCPVLITHV